MAEPDLSEDSQGSATLRRSLAVSLIRGFDSPGEATEAAVQVLTLAALAGADLEAINLRAEERLRGLSFRPDRRPHSRACGPGCPGHGSVCAPDCPTCHPADGSALAQRAHPSSPPEVGPDDSVGFIRSTDLAHDRAYPGCLRPDPHSHLTDLAALDRLRSWAPPE